MNFLGFVLFILGYALFYTGLCDFAHHNTTLFESLGFQSTAGPAVDTTQYQYNSPVPNMSGQPAVYGSGTGINGTQVV